MPQAVTFFIAVAVGGLLVREARERSRAALFWKCSASFGFVALALSAGALRHGAAPRIVVVGLALAACGDVALALPGPRAFFAGLALFLLGHVAYVRAFAELVPIAKWPSVWSFIPVVATVAAYRWLAPHLGSMKGPVIAYMATITVMVIGALAVERAGAVHALRLFTGALLFYLSDLSVARDRFVARRFVNRAWGLPAYYAAQVLFAWATA
ncbi:MAG TPA: lysoplasmalogenase [Polyangiaceae bacterium]|nr:lysoplasmalogenase [Polyangiaceae bacterium]